MLIFGRVYAASALSPALPHCNRSGGQSGNVFVRLCKCCFFGFWPKSHAFSANNGDIGDTDEA